MNLGQALAQVRADTSLSSIEQDRRVACRFTAIRSRGPNASLKGVLPALAGTATGFMLARYLNLSPNGQFVASTLGFGLGSLLGGQASFLTPRNVNAFGVLP